MRRPRLSGSRGLWPASQAAPQPSPQPGEPGGELPGPDVLFPLFPHALRALGPVEQV